MRTCTVALSALLCSCSLPGFSVVGDDPVRAAQQRERIAEPPPTERREPSASELLAEGDRLRDTGNVSRAAWSYLRALRADPNQSSARERIGFLHLTRGDTERAQTAFEVVLAQETSPGLAAAAKGWVEALAKTAVVVHDAPGFASSRLGVAIALEAMRMVEEGVASAEDIDAAMVLGYKHPVGPLKTTDIVGLDVRLGIAEYLASTLGERFAPPQILRDKVARGELGRKSGKGFFDWQ